MVMVMLAGKLVWAPFGMNSLRGFDTLRYPLFLMKVIKVTNPELDGFLGGTGYLIDS